MSSDSLGCQSLYESLPLSPGHIRLLILHPDPDPKAVITCSLTRKPLDATKQPAHAETGYSDSILKFEALSYAWGEPGDEGIIIVNGMNVSIRRNLLHALQHLRHAGESSSLEKRMLWIDAICIDQQNVGERNHQVSQIGEIYRNAQRVVIWLGLASADSASALLFISSVSDSWKNVKGRSNIPSMNRQSEFEAVRHLCQRSYWRRLWIVQEILMANQAIIQCGFDSITWEEFSKFQVALEWERIPTPLKDDLSDLLESPAFNLDRHQAAYRLNEASLEVLVAAFSASECSELRDKIYGLAGLANDTRDLNIDYSKSLFEIFHDVLMLRAQESCSSTVAFARFLQHMFEGAVRSSIPLDVHILPDFVGAMGYHTGTVQGLGPFLSEFVSLPGPETDKDEFATWLTKTLINTQTFLERVLASKDIIAESVIPILSSISYGLEGGGYFPSNKRNLRGELQYDSEYRPWDYLAKQVPGKVYEINPQTKLDYEQAEPQFFYDHDGIIGIAPSNARPTDIVCRFQKCDIVAILRRKNDSLAFVGRAVVFQDLTMSNVIGGRFLMFDGLWSDGLWSEDVPKFEPSVKPSGLIDPPHTNFGSPIPISIYADAHTIQLLTQ